MSGSFNSKGAVESFSGAMIFAGPVSFTLQPGRPKGRRIINRRGSGRIFRKFMELDLAHLISQCNLYVSLRVVRIISDSGVNGNRSYCEKFYKESELSHYKILLTIRFLIYNSKYPL